MYYRTTQ